MSRPDRPRAPAVRGRVRYLVAAGGALLILGACSGAPEPTLPRLSNDGPFIATAPQGLVEEALWVEDLPELDLAELRLVIDMLDSDRASAVLLPSTTSRSVVIAVRGDGCRPEVNISLTETAAAFTVMVYIAEPIHDPAFECAAILKAHVFELRLSREIELEDLVIEVHGQP